MKLGDRVVLIEEDWVESAGSERVTFPVGSTGVVSRSPGIHKAWSQLPKVRSLGWTKNPNPRNTAGMWIHTLLTGDPR